jgi:hypothetical protein
VTSTTDARQQFYTIEQLGETRERTPEGFLLCKDVPVARTGVQMYGPGETPVEVGPDGAAWVERSAEDVFRPETVASANGKSLVNEHPEGEDDVNPDNWKELTDGIMLYPRRGEGQHDGMLVADILVCDRKAIGLVDDGKVELSLGYDCDYEQTEPGRGKQSNIVINHVALVEKGRCGSRCSIGDKAFEGEITVAKLKETVIAAFKTGDQAKLDAVLAKVKDADLEDTPMVEKDEEGDTHIHVHAPESPIKKWTDDDLDELDQRLAKLETEGKAAADAKKAKDEETEAERLQREQAGLASAAEDEQMENEFEEEAPEGTGDKARKAKDSAFLVDSFQSTIALAEIIHPGIAVPTMDAAAAPKKTYDALCAFRRKVLTVASSTADGAALVAEVNGGRAVTADSIAKMTGDRTRLLFSSVGAAVKRNNAVGPTLVVTDKTKDAGLKTVADLNAANAAFWKEQR